MITLLLTVCGVVAVMEIPLAVAIASWTLRRTICWLINFLDFFWKLCRRRDRVFFLSVDGGSLSSTVCSPLVISLRLTSSIFCKLLLHLLCSTWASWLSSFLFSAPFSPMTRDKVWQYVATRFYCVVSWCIAIPYYLTLRICTLAHTADSVLDRVFLIHFLTFLAAFHMVPNLVALDMVGCWIDTRSGSSFSITSIHGQIFCDLFSKQPLWVCSLVRGDWAPHKCVSLWFWSKWCTIRRFYVGYAFCIAHQLSPFLLWMIGCSIDPTFGKADLNSRQSLVSGHLS